MFVSSVMLKALTQLQNNTHLGLRFTLSSSHLLFWMIFMFSHQWKLR